MTDVAALVGAIVIPLILAVAQLALPVRAPVARVLVSVLAAGASFGLLVCYASARGFDGGPVGFAWMPQFRLDFFLLPDRLGMFFAMLVAGIGVLVVLYARGYFGPDGPTLYRFYPTLLLFMTAMLGLVLSDNFMLLVLFWELTSISSFLLIGWDREDADAVKKALQAFVVTFTGGLALLTGLILLGVHTGAWTFSELLARGVQHDAITTSAFVLIFVGAAAKSAQWPLHFWLPGAMAAPTPVSAYLHSATMVKAGVYLVGRLWPAMAPVLPSWPTLLVTFGAITMVVGAYVALRKQDLKLIFAYTTVSQLGLFISAYGLSAWQTEEHPTLLWEITQILNHALYKAPLFLLAGGIAHVVGSRELHDLRGLARRGGTAGLMGVLVLIAAYAMAAGPFTLSFAAKELYLYGISHWYESTRHGGAIALGLAAVVAAAITVAIFVRMLRVMLAAPQASPRPHREEEHGTGFWPAMLWAPAALLIALQLLGGFAPPVFDAIFGRIEVTRLYFKELPSTPYLISHPGAPLLLSAAAVVLGVVLGLLPVLRRTIEDAHDRLFPAFYALSTRGGGRLFGVVQTGNLRTYLLIIFAVIVVLPWWSAFRAGGGLQWWLPTFVRIEPVRDLLPGYLITVLVCASAALMPLVRQRASRIIVLGSVGFAVTALYYFSGAPDLALTQISIEIVSLILFLLVLSQLPETPRQRDRRIGWQTMRLAISVALGATMFWLALASTTSRRPPMPYRAADGTRFDYVGQFFLRNSYDAVDVPGREKGGGGNNVVNVILVDFRGFDTLGEVTVLGIAALGVWTLLRRRHPRRSTHALHRNLSETRYDESVHPTPRAQDSLQRSAST